MSADRTSESLYLVDAFSLIFQVFHAIPGMTTPKGLPSNAVFGFTKDMLFLRSQRKPTYLVCCFDEPGKTFRDELYADYKANRGPMPDDLQLQIPMIRQMLEAMRIPVLGLRGYHAHHPNAPLATGAGQASNDSFLRSRHQDCRPLFSGPIKVFNPRKQIGFAPAALLTDWGVRPDQVVDYQTLVG